MRTRTEIANSALSHLSAGSIASIDDDLDEKARAIKPIFDQVAQEVIRGHRWNCCMKRATLSQSADSRTKTEAFGYSYAYPLPNDCLRFTELNGEPYKGRTEYLDINGRTLLTNAESALIRYVGWEPDTTQWDVLLAEAVAVKLAMRICRRITKDGISPQQLFQLYEATVDQARVVDAMEVGSGENGSLERILERSPMVRAGRGANRLYGPAARIGLNLDLSE